MMEHGPRSRADSGCAIGTGDLVMLHDTLIGAVVAGDGDADRAVGVVSHEGRVLEPELAPEHRDLRTAAAVEDLNPVDRGDQ